MDKLTALKPNDWVKNYADVLLKYTHTGISNFYAAKDIVQETFLSAWPARDSYHARHLRTIGYTLFVKARSLIVSVGSQPLMQNTYPGKKMNILMIWITGVLQPGQRNEN